MKTLTKGAVCLVLFLSIGAAPLARAESDSNRPDKARMPMVGVRAEGINFCEALPQISAKIESMLADRAGKIDEKRMMRQGKRIDHRMNKDEGRNDRRSDKSEKMDDRFEALMSKAGNDAQKEAVAKFIEAVKAATEKRQEAVNDAIEAYQKGVDDLVASRVGDVDEAVNDYKEAIKDALDTAKEECAHGTDSKTARMHFAASLKAAHDAFKIDRMAVDKIRDQIKVLQKTRKDAIMKAMETFKKEMEEAKNDLKAALPKSEKSDNKNGEE